MENGNLMEYVQNRALSYESLHDIVMSIAVGVHYLYSRQPVSIVHRDFKPENILVNKYAQVKIADFGISKQMLNHDKQTSSPLNNKVLTADITSLTHSNIGTVRWIAPEILCYASTHTHLSDIYSLGLLIHFVFSGGKVPYFEEYKNNGAQIAYAKSQNKRPFLNDTLLIPSEFYVPIKELIISCTELDPHMRPQHPEAIVTKLLNFRTRLSQNDDSQRPEHGN
jgi:serine/threonine-protein kinase